MIEINYLRNNAEEVKKRLEIKHFKDGAKIVNQILKIDTNRRTCQQQLDDLLNKSNVLSKQIGDLYKQGNKSEADALKTQTAELKENIAVLEKKMTGFEAKWEAELIKLPNLPHASVPQGKTPEENVTVKQVGKIPELPPSALPHWELANKLQLIDFELGVKITGAGFPVYKGKGAKLQRALINFFLDEAEKAGYAETQPPVVINKDSAFGTGQLPDKEGQMYYIKADDLYLIPTAEVPLTNIYRNEILNEAQLPIKVCGYTPCFRREAGSYGAHVRGLNRLHQFDKVEIVQIAHPKSSYKILDEMVAHVEGLLKKLELPYRILRLCGGDMSFASALTYDFEVYSTAQSRWLEVSSVSNFETFQSNRLKCRFKSPDSKKNELVHTLNGSALALPRIVAALLENNQTASGSIEIPKALHKYTGFKTID